MVVEFGVPHMAERTFAALTSSIGEARRFARDAVAGAAAGPGARAHLVGDLELAVSELVTNAVEYGLDEPVTVEVGVTESVAVVAVTSVRTASEIADPSTWAGPLPAVLSGRGLAIVRSVSDDVSVDADGATITVRCTFRLG
jgi:anti-sigma regulatory factor (Ser/Thr protein kinase)